ncbi:MAG: DUF1573 domain-containing protein [Planctomycetes bacterium]|nr:DUF1573 domain-containing protein [Planctomycetota bacterium]
MAAFFSLGSAFLSLPIAAQDVGPVAPSEAPQLEYHLTAEPGEVDFGEAFQGEVLEREVLFTNTGAKAFPVARLQTSCGCTVAKLFGPDGAELPIRPKGTEPLVVLEPGDVMRTKVEFRTQGKHGLVQQKMQVHHTDPKVPPASVDVTVRVSQGIEVTPAWVNLGNISKSERVEQIVTLSSLDIGGWTIKGFENQIEGQELPDWLKFEIVPKDPKDTSNDQKVKVIVDGERPVGAISPRVRIDIDHDRIHSADFTITGIVQPNVKFDSGDATFAENINFDKIAPDEKVTRTLKVTNLDPSVPYVLESADLLTTKKEFFTTAVREIEKGVSYEIDVTVDGGIGDPFFRGSLVIKAQHPDVPSKMIPFHGWVKK